MTDLLEVLGTQASPGWQKLGSALGGAVGGDTGGMTPGYVKGRKERASLDELLAKAQIKQQEAIQRDQFKGALAASGLVPPNLVDVITSATVGGMGSDFSGSMTGIQTGTETGLLNEAGAAARGGDVDLMNALGAARTGNPLERTKVTSGVAYDPYAAPGDQDVEVTPVGAAAIEADQARAEKARRIDAGKTGGSSKPVRDYVGEDIIKRELDAVDVATERELIKARTPQQREQVMAKRREGYAQVRARHGQAPQAEPVVRNPYMEKPDLMTVLQGMALDRRKAGKPRLTGADVKAVEKMRAAGVPMVDPLDAPTADSADAARKKAGVQEPAESIVGNNPVRRDGRSPPQVVDLNASMNPPATRKTGSKPPVDDGTLRDASGKPVRLDGAKKPRPAAKQAKPPVKGARQAKDGFWYIPDRSRPGKYLRVDG